MVDWFGAALGMAVWAGLLGLGIVATAYAFRTAGRWGSPHLASVIALGGLLLPCLAALGGVDGLAILLVLLFTVGTLVYALSAWVTLGLVSCVWGPSSCRQGALLGLVLGLPLGARGVAAFCDASELTGGLPWMALAGVFTGGLCAVLAAALVRRYHGSDWIAF